MRGFLSSFGRGLAKGAVNPEASWKSMVEHLGLATEGGRNVAVLVGFMDALREIDAGLSDSLLEYAVEHQVLARWFPLLQMPVPIDATGIVRLKKSIEVGKAPMWMYKTLAIRCQDAVSGADLKVLVQLIAAKPDGYDPALEILYMRLNADNSNHRAHSPEVIEAGRDLMMHLEIGRDQSQPDRRLGNIANMCLSGEGGGDVARHIFRRLKQAIIERRETSTYAFSHLVSALLAAQPLPSLDELFSGSDPERRAGLKIIAAKSDKLGNPLDAVREDALLECCDQDPASRYPAIASAISIFHKPDAKAPLQWTALACRVLKKAPDSIEVLTAFAQRFRPMAWSGSRASIMEERAQVLGQLDASFGPRVVDFAKAELARLNHEIEAERKRETDHDRKADERFE